jgi:hypothetical protein
MTMNEQNTYVLPVPVYLGFQATKPQLYFYSAPPTLSPSGALFQVSRLPVFRDDKINQCKVDDDGLTQRKMNKILTLSIPQTTNPSRCPRYPAVGWIDKKKKKIK